MIAIIIDIVVSTVISVTGIPGLAPIPLLDVAITLAWFFIFGLLVDDQLKTRLLPHLRSKK